jgi:shikimate dehydrogenase
VHGVAASLAGAAHTGEATVLGSGATSRSVLAALAGLGVRRVRLAVRAQARPATLRLAADLGLDVAQVPIAHWADVGGLAVSTLPGGAGGEAADALHGRAVEGTLLDVVYAGWPTPLARAARAAGLEVVSGLDMLVHQAAEQVRLMTGRSAPLDAMFAAGRAAVAP